MLTWLAELPGAFHLFRYLTFRTLGAAATGLFLVFFFGPTIISALRLKQGKGQPIRVDGPKKKTRKSPVPAAPSVRKVRYRNRWKAPGSSASQVSMA